jgi:hypothetical protein
MCFMNSYAKNEIIFANIDIIKKIFKISNNLFGRVTSGALLTSLGYLKAT